MSLMIDESCCIFVNTENSMKWSWASFDIEVPYLKFQVFDDFNSGWFINDIPFYKAEN